MIEQIVLKRGIVSFFLKKSKINKLIHSIQKLINKSVGQKDSSAMIWSIIDEIEKDMGKHIGMTTTTDW